MESKARFLFFTLMGWAIVAYSFAYEGHMDFAYLGGAYMMDKTGYENTVINRFVHALLKVGGFKQEEVKTGNFDDETELYAQMKKGRVVIAGVSLNFFKRYESELGLKPLVVPMIEGEAYFHYCIIVRKDNDPIKTTQDLWGKNLSMIDYSDGWYNEILRMVNLPEVIVMEKYPENQSVVMAVLNKYVDAGLLTDYNLERFFSSHPQLRGEIKIIEKTKKRLIPPLVYQKGRLTDEDANRIVSILEEAPDKGEINSILITMGFSGFRKVTREEIINGSP
ncbi:MAG: PhnD/SsuA/transferrin family substrate-binding protein [Pseudomonadota bacterium]